MEKIKWGCGGPLYQSFKEKGENPFKQSLFWEFQTFFSVLAKVFIFEIETDIGLLFQYKCSLHSVCFLTLTLKTLFFIRAGRLQQECRKISKEVKRGYWRIGLAREYHVFPGTCVLMIHD